MSYILRPYPDVIKAAIGRIVKDERIKSNAKRVSEYIGQARHLDERLASRLSGYEQHIDRSLKAHGLYSENNPYGYKVNFLHYPEKTGRNGTVLHSALRRKRMVVKEQDLEGTEDV